VKDLADAMDMILEPIQSASDVHRGKTPPERYRWMSDLSMESLISLIEGLRIKTQEVLNLFFETHSLDVVEVLNVWLADQVENMHVHPQNPKKPENLA
jgi:hypothetical protein